MLRRGPKPAPPQVGAIRRTLSLLAVSPWATLSFSVRQGTGRGTSCGSRETVRQRPRACPYDKRPVPSYAHRPVKRELPGPSGKRRPAPGSYSGGGPHLSARGQTCVHILTGSALANGRSNGFTLRSLVTACAAAHTSMLRARQCRLSCHGSLVAHVRDARDSRELPVPVRVRAPGGSDVSYAAGRAATRWPPSPGAPPGPAAR